MAALDSRGHCLTARVACNLLRASKPESHRKVVDALTFMQTWRRSASTGVDCIIWGAAIKAASRSPRRVGHKVCCRERVTVSRGAGDSRSLWSVQSVDWCACHLQTTPHCGRTKPAGSTLHQGVSRRPGATSTGALCRVVSSPEMASWPLDGGVSKMNLASAPYVMMDGLASVGKTSAERTAIVGGKASAVAKRRPVR